MVLLSYFSGWCPNHQAVFVHGLTFSLDWKNEEDLICCYFLFGIYLVAQKRKWVTVIHFSQISRVSMLGPLIFCGVIYIYIFISILSTSDSWGEKTSNTI